MNSSYLATDLILVMTDTLLAASVDIGRRLQCPERSSSDKSGGGGGCGAVMFVFRFVATAIGYIRYSLSWLENWVHLVVMGLTSEEGRTFLELDIRILNIVPTRSAIPSSTPELIVRRPYHPGLEIGTLTAGVAKE